MATAVDPINAILCSPRQKDFLRRLCSSESSKANLPTYSMEWQLCSGFTSYDKIAYTWQAVASHHPVLRTSLLLLKDGSFDAEVRD